MNWKTETLAETRERLRRAWGDYPLTILIINPINLYLVRLVGRTALTPNQISLFSFVLMTVAAICMAFRSSTAQAAGGIILLIAYLLDCLDGDLARLKGLKSPLGAMLDPILNRCGEIVVILGISINGWKVSQDPWMLVGGIILMATSQLYFYITDAMLNIFRKRFGLLDPSGGKKLFGTRVRVGAIEPFIWGQAFFSLAGVTHWGVPTFGVMFSAGCAYQFYKLYKVTRLDQASGSKDFEVHVW